MPRRAFYTGRDMARILSVAEMRAAALRRLPALVGEYVEAGAEDEVTLARNGAAFQAVQFMPPVLRGVAPADVAPPPLAVAPMGFAGMIAPQGDLAIARAARNAGIAMCQSTVSNATLEAVAPIIGAAHWMQVYVFRSRPFMAQLLDRCRATGITRLVLTLDANVFGNRDWDRRSYRADGRPRLHRQLEALRHPGWLARVWAPGLPTFGNLASFLPEGQRDLASAAKWSREQIDPGLDWDWLDWLRARWQGELWVKGVMRSADAARLVAAGVDGIVVSNHGGRQLDRGAATLAALPGVVAGAGDVPVWLDSGVRRGSDIVAALASGAAGVLVGRPVLYGLAAGGEAGVARVLAILNEEYARCMALLGAKGPQDLRGDPDLLVRP